MASDLIRGKLGVALVALALGACEAAPADQTAAPPSGASHHQGIDGTLLYEKVLGPDHTVQFWDMGQGLNLIRESASIDGNPQLVTRGKEFESLAPLWTQLNAGDVNVPASILSADGRAAARRKLRAQTAVATSAPTTAPAASLPPGVIAASSCSPDYGHDNWGAAWFNANYCRDSLTRWCPTNWGSADSGMVHHRYTSWTQMEGDYNVGAQINGYIIRCTLFGTTCGPTTQFVNQPLAPRHILEFHWTDEYDRVEWYGFSPCGHGDAAWEWN
jgi:hypothetical protein